MTVCIGWGLKSWSMLGFRVSRVYKGKPVWELNLFFIDRYLKGCVRCFHWCSDRVLSERGTDAAVSM